MLEIHKRVGRPELGTQLVTRDDFPGSFQNSQEDLERLVL
jgi:hypothetical protein